MFATATKPNYKFNDMTTKAKKVETVQTRKANLIKELTSESRPAKMLEDMELQELQNLADKLELIEAIASDELPRDVLEMLPLEDIISMSKNQRIVEESIEEAKAKSGGKNNYAANILSQFKKDGLTEVSWIKMEEAIMLENWTGFFKKKPGTPEPTTLALVFHFIRLKYITPNNDSDDSAERTKAWTKRAHAYFRSHMSDAGTLNASLFVNKAYDSYFVRKGDTVTLVKKVAAAPLKEAQKSEE